MKKLALALDVGGTKIAAALITPDGAMLAQTRRPTNAQQGRDAVLEAMAASIDELLLQAADGALAGRPRDATAGVHGAASGNASASADGTAGGNASAGDYTLAGIGISAAGVIDPLNGVVADATDAMPGWKGTQLAAWFGQRYRLPVHAANDVQCALLGELWRNPALQGVNGQVAMLALGTGLGGAIAQAGRVLPGRHGIAGHFGRALLWDAMLGRHAPVESLVSGTGLATIHARLAEAPTTGRAAASEAPDRAALDGEGVMTAAARGDALARQALDIWLDQLALQLHNIYWSIDPQLLLIGGGVIDAQHIWWPLVEDRIAAYNIALDMAPAALGAQAGVYGAAQLVWKHA